MSDKKYKKEDCLQLLQNKYTELQIQGQNRYPRRSDFEEREVVAIKAFLGPWPRALEESGIKPANDTERQLKKQERRIRIKRKHTEYFKKIKQEQKTTKKQENKIS